MKNKHKNQKEYFKLLIDLGDNYQGEQFRLRFSTNKVSSLHYDCSNIKGDFINCQMVDNQRVLCFLGNHGLLSGQMIVETTIFVPDSLMPDGYIRLNSKEYVVINIEGESYGLELTDGKSDVFETTDVDLKIIGTVIKGDPFRYEDFTPEEIEELQKPAKEAAEKLEADFKRETEALKTDYDKKVEDLKKEYDAKVEALETDYENKVSELETDYETKSGNLSRDYTKVKSNLITDYNTVKKDLDKDYQDTKATLAADYESTKTQLQNQYDTKISAITKEYEDLQTQLEQKVDEKSRELEGKVDDKINEADNAIKETKEKVDKELVGFKSEIATDYAQLKEASDAAIAANQEATRSATTAITNANAATTAAQNSAHSAQNAASLVNDNIAVNTQVANSAKQESAEAKSASEDAVFRAQGAVGTANSAAQLARQAKAIAEGRATGYVFNTLEDMNAALLNAEFVAQLVLGDNLYIRDTSVSDYWWDGESAQKLETEHPDLSGYVKFTDWASTNNAGVVKVYTSGLHGVAVNPSNGILTIARAGDADILAKASTYRPIAPSNLDYAVKVGITTNQITLRM